MQFNATTAGARETRDLPQGDHAIQLYSLGTPNGQKVTVLLEELGLPYDAWKIDIQKGDQFTSGFVAINPNSKIPALVDREGPGGKPVSIFESGNILLYLAEKHGKFIPQDPAKRIETLNWLFFQVGAAPYFGQLGHFYKHAPEKIEYAINRYKVETQRLLDVLDKHLEGKTWLVNEEFTIADIAWYPWVRGIKINANEVVQTENYKNLVAWVARAEARESAKRGLIVNTQDLPEYHSPK